MKKLKKKKKEKKMCMVFLMRIDENGFNTETIVPGAFQTADLKPTYYNIIKELNAVHGQNLIISMNRTKSINLHLRHYYD